jgi:hypothetical protein
VNNEVHPRKMIKGDPGVIKVGNSTGIMLPCPSTPEESEQAERELHAVTWEIAEKLWEKGDRSCMRTRRSYQ